jgi:ADP-ribosyl-[dinitrogen reductase] hydrolase
LQAVNLGGDSDTIGALAGGLAGMIYGSAEIPDEWLSVLARKDDIIDLSTRFSKTIGE